ncbi:AT-hook motif nuclear-localized protein 9-like [Olea europaea var. sylvestris]|uniref:AT-hook motif nuclear-localized protein n=1 Tax=Olea europaea subsp. europaea TaxID=158383 RepID=A0A8S0QLB9_OLEEU|nr:AT-hook motif nuclear-localized protein 9-like [Olea europaea var. sylvestris]CAA2968821.1 AT-hook motif nuclear-localized 5-like [Olea europaea subsp. europaea]
MDGREGMSLPGSASYYFNRGGIGGSGGSGPGSNAPAAGGGSVPGTLPASGGMHTPSRFNPVSNPIVQLQPNVGASGSATSGSTFHVENPSPIFPRRSITRGDFSSASTSGDPVKKKRGRPRKYGPDGANMTLALSPMSASTSSTGVIAPGEKKRGRPPGTGWKQKLAPLGEWMNSSAGLAFTPHVLHIGVGEDVAAKILAFAQQRPRALCILSANGSISSVTLRQPTTSDGTVTYEGRFEILCLSGSYLLAESGGPRNRTGGISISVCSPDGHIIGGAIGGNLIAASSVQVVACSFVYGGSKAKDKTVSEPKDEKIPADESAEKSLTPVSAAPSQNLTPNSATVVWPLETRLNMKNSQAQIDLMLG